MMDGVKTEEVWLLGPLADGGAIIRDEQRGRRPGFYPSFEAGLRVLWDVFKVLLFVFSSY